jgi:steroid delta-isomerase-like uncharacterized protein
VSSEAEENKAIVRRFLEELVKGNLDVIDELLTPDFVDRALMPGQGSTREDFKRTMEEIHEAFSTTSFTIEEQVAEGDTVVTKHIESHVSRGEFAGLPATGKVETNEGIYIHRLHRGKITEEWSLVDARPVMEDLAQEIRERERVEQELRVARSIQQASLPEEVPQTFASGLRNILRADPDIVMIGEIRDMDTAKISVEAALTGHLVLATLHTNDAPGALSRLTDMGVEPYLTSSAVDCVIAQRLVRKLCERCRGPVEIEREILEGMEFPFGLVPDGLHFHKAVGCRRCGGSGYRGRTGIYEVMVVSDQIRKLILLRSSATEISRVAESQGMVRLRDDGLLKAAKGITTIEEALKLL